MTTKRHDMKSKQGRESTMSEMSYYDQIEDNLSIVFHQMNNINKIVHRHKNTKDSNPFVDMEHDKI